MRISTAPTRTEILFIDTWGWLALADDRQAGHARAVAEYRNRKAPGAKVTTDFALDETLSRLFKSSCYEHARQFCQRIFDSAAAGFVRLERIDPERFQGGLAAPASLSRPPRYLVY